MSSTSPGEHAAHRACIERSARFAVATVVLLSAFVTARALVIPDDAQFASNVAMAALLGAIAYCWGLCTDELGLKRSTVAGGLRWGGAAAALVVVVVTVVSLVPAGTDAFAGAGVDLDLGQVLVRVVVIIPLGTVVLEELAFRGVLLGGLRRVLSNGRAVALSAVLFGLWHIAPALGDATTDTGPTATTSGLGVAANVGGTVLVTTVAGLVFIWLRDRSDSLLAPALAHLAINASALVAAAVLGGS